MILKYKLFHNQLKMNCIPPYISDIYVVLSGIGIGEASYRKASRDIWSDKIKLNIN